MVEGERIGRSDDVTIVSWIRLATSLVNSVLLTVGTKVKHVKIFLDQNQTNFFSGIKTKIY